MEDLEAALEEFRALAETLEGVAVELAEEPDDLGIDATEPGDDPADLAKAVGEASEPAAISKAGPATGTSLDTTMSQT